MTTILIITSILAIIFIVKEASYDNTRNKDGSVNKSISWAYVNGKFRTMNRKQMQCPKCGLGSENLLWFEFRTSDDSWKHLVGRMGFYSKCPNCNIVVGDIVTVMN